MANYANTKSIIAQNIYTNHEGQVTAEMVKTAANEIVNTLIAGGYIYAGIAKLTPTQTNPGSPDANVFYIATEPGTYTNFVGAGGSLVVADGEVAIFKWNGSWSKEVTGAATAAQVSQLGQEVYDFISYSSYIHNGYLYNRAGVTPLELLYADSASYKFIIIKVTPGVQYVTLGMRHAVLLADFNFITKEATPVNGATWDGLADNFTATEDAKYLYSLYTGSNIINGCKVPFMASENFKEIEENISLIKGNLDAINNDLYVAFEMVPGYSVIRGSSGGAVINPSDKKISNYADNTKYIDVFAVESGKTYKITDKNHKYSGNPNPYCIVGFSANLLTIGDIIPTILVNGSDGVNINEIQFTAPSNGYIYAFHYSNNSYFDTYRKESTNVINEIQEELSSGKEGIFIRERNLVLQDYRTKKFSVLGDSYSTFVGYLTPSTNRSFYGPGGEGTSDVTDVIQTWWYRVAAMKGLQLDINNSYSGSPVCNTGYGGGDASAFSFVSRMSNIGSPDVIMIMGGTNDSWAEVPLGDFVYSGWTENDLKQFRPAFAYMLDYLLTNHPNAIIFQVTNSGLSANITSSIATICEHYGVQNIQLFNVDHQYSGHPGKDGQADIANQVLAALVNI